MKVGCRKGSKTPHLIPSHLALSHARRVSAVAAIPHRPPYCEAADTAKCAQHPNHMVQTLSHALDSHITNKLNFTALTAVKLGDSQVIWLRPWLPKVRGA